MVVVDGVGVRGVGSWVLGVGVGAVTMTNKAHPLD